MFLNKRNTAFFSSCNNEYIPYSAVSLLSIRKFLPKAKLFIFSRDISLEHRQFLENNNIGYFDLDLRGKFYRHWTYPTECYYLFAGPEILLKQGFKYSVYIDGDTLCLRNPLHNIGIIKGVAGLAVGDCRGVFLDDFDGLKKLFNLSEEQTSRRRIASGIVYFNNKKMSKIHLLELSAKYFDQCLKSLLPRKGDDSLFSLIQILHLSEQELKDLPYSNQMLLSNIQSAPSEKDIFFHFTHGKPWNNCGDAEKDKYYSHKLSLWRNIFTEHFSPRWTTQYHQEQTKNQHEAEKQENQRLEQLAKAGLVLSPKKRKANNLKKPIKLFVCEDQHLGLINFGDEVQKDIIPTIFGYKITPISEAAKAELFSVGSILFSLPFMNAKKTIHVWGSGFISEEEVDKEKNILPKINIASVRGELTLKRIKEHTNIKSLPLGDPGILANIVYPENPTKTNKIGIVHHYIDASNPLVEKARNDKRFLVIDPLEPPKQVASQISSCKFIISSSLHGLIFADSYKIPNAHIQFSDKVYGGEYKFKDYDSGIGKKHLEFNPDKLFDEKYIQSLTSKYKPIQNLEQIQQNLINCFPYK